MSRKKLSLDWHGRKDEFLHECMMAYEHYMTSLRQPKQAQLEVLQDIISISRNALHWRESGYSESVTDEQSFRDHLPIMRYEDFEPYIERESQSKGGVLTCSPVMRWLKTSGTTGVPKKIPYTLHWLQSYRIPAMKVLWATYIRAYPEILDHPYAVLDTQTVREDVQEHLQGVCHQAISNRHPRINANDWCPPWYEEPWFVPEMPIAHDQKMYHRIRHFIGKRLHCISAINPSTLISIKDYFSKFREILIKDVRNGTLEGAPFCAPDEPLAQELESILARPDFTLVDIWPQLKFISCWLTASAGLYGAKLNTIFPGVSKLPFMSCGSEGVTTIPVDNTAHSQPLAINQAYFEFVPHNVALRELVERREQVETLTFDQLQVGQDYHLIMSQGNGFYRLWTGDIYRIDQIVDGIPWLHFIRRDGVFHSFTGEKLTETQICEALDRSLELHGLSKGLFMCGPSWGEPPHYVVMVEVPAADGQNAAKLAATLDDQLKIENIEYASKRESNRLAPIEVRAVDSNAITHYVESKRAGPNANQYKYKPFQQNLDFISAVTTR
ncbi:GH3 auxin-responsive promoter family protein [Pseudomonas sp. 5P_3.1_Bac2]|uniref:GH3 auxin-responsive promoter family protein n=1 Tax=Pseudomonas sp. 5P_3.1_Bac2 TaxID=2971617 RepID=UPI0021C69580|nr:GH3 auxin-responsive promoter family protein [Pseudomonas sp. 5P_3.1_Bac2]MCU1717260.1 GH3 auxin-responsive promoter family protein [Pseudomonas sp. 5P_3.1_Bac2]